MFRKVLVANRGEIALRVLRTCRELGITTVAIYSPVDREAPHRFYADEAHEVRGEDPLRSYLDIEGIVRVAREAGAEAVHPGYGFLAENADFVRRCEEEGLVFVGPDARAMEVSGDKLRAKAVLKAAGLPVSPGSDEPLGDEGQAQEAAEAVGYPVILKVSCGGGGIGMEVVPGPEGLPAALARARSLARSAFGVEEVFLEKYHPRARHIEVQILAHGRTAIHLGERECSIQRRYQKLIEEAPSPAVDEATREEIGALSVQAAKALGYRNAGTLEYVYAEGAFFFNEVNARLQVEHPVTEMVTGLDLVAEQLAIAAGEGLRLDQEDVALRGWAFECRINAEDPFRDFLPSPGRVGSVVLPAGPGVRVDTYLRPGTEVAEAYDPLVAKVIVWGRDRPEAVRRMVRALAELKVEGVDTNVALHEVVFRDEAFRRGSLSTTFLADRRVPEALQTLRHERGLRREALVAALAAAAVASEGSIPRRTETFPVRPREPGGWVRAGRERQHLRRFVRDRALYRRP